MKPRTDDKPHADEQPGRPRGKRGPQLQVEVGADDDETLLCKVQIIRALCADLAERITRRHEAREKL